MQLENLLVPCVRFTRVLPICRVANIDGAFTSYQSFLMNGSTLKNKLNVVNTLLKTANGSLKVLKRSTHGLISIFYVMTCQLLQLYSVNGRLNMPMEHWWNDGNGKADAHGGVKKLSQYHFKVTNHIQYTTPFNEQRSVSSWTNLRIFYFKF